MKVVKLDDVLKLIDGSMADLESNYENSKLQEEIKRLPTVDAVEVVRCKDCKHYKEYDGEIECWARPMLFPREPDDYCSMGERREKCRD